MTASRQSMRRRDFLFSAGALALAPFAFADAEKPARRSRISFYRDGEIHVGFPGESASQALTTGHWDFKPSWSRTDDLLVCFRRLQNDPDPMKWKTAVFVIGADGKGFHALSDGTRTDFNPTWTRDGANTPVWNRLNPATGGFHVMRGAVGGKPGEETTLTDLRYHTWVHSGLQDGRLLVNAAHPAHGKGVFLLSVAPGGAPRYERVACELSAKGQLHRASLSPSERRICFEFLAGDTFTEPGHVLFHADFDVRTRTIANLRAFANPAGKAQWFAYPRWIDGESAIVYHSGETGQNQLYVHRLGDGTTRRVSADGKADYRYPHGEAAPC